MSAGSWNPPLGPYISNSSCRILSRYCPDIVQILSRYCPDIVRILSGRSNITKLQRGQNWTYIQRLTLLRPPMGSVFHDLSFFMVLEPSLLHKSRFLIEQTEKCLFKANSLRNVDFAANNFCTERSTKKNGFFRARSAPLTFVLEGFFLSQKNVDFSVRAARR